MDINTLFEKINNKTVYVGVIENEKCINLLNSEKFYILDVQDVDSKKYPNTFFNPTSDLQSLKRCDFLIICIIYFLIYL